MLDIPIFLVYNIIKTKEVKYEGSKNNTMPSEKRKRNH